MQELEGVLSYLKERSLVLGAQGLRARDKTILFVINNRILNAISLDNPAYKTMNELLQESSVSIVEMHDDIVRLMDKGDGELKIIDDFTFNDALEELGNTDLGEHQNCVSYLSDLAVASLAVIQCNDDLDSEALLVFESIIHIAIVALNLFNSVHGLEPVLKGVGIRFDRKRRARENSYQ